MDYKIRFENNRNIRCKLFESQYSCFLVYDFQISFETVLKIKLERILQFLQGTQLLGHALLRHFKLMMKVHASLLYKIIVLLRQNTLLLQLRPVRFNVNSDHEYSLYTFLLVFVFRVKSSFIIQKCFGFFFLNLISLTTVSPYLHKTY